MIEHPGGKQSHAEQENVPKFNAGARAGGFLVLRINWIIAFAWHFLVGVVSFAVCLLPRAAGGDGLFLVAGA